MEYNSRKKFNSGDLLERSLGSSNCWYCQITKSLKNAFYLSIDSVPTSMAERRTPAKVCNLRIDHEKQPNPILIALTTPTGKVLRFMYPIAQLLKRAWLKKQRNGALWQLSIGFSCERKKIDLVHIFDYQLPNCTWVLHALRRAIHKNPYGWNLREVLFNDISQRSLIIGISNDWSQPPTLSSFNANENFENCLQSRRKTNTKMKIRQNIKKTKELCSTANFRQDFHNPSTGYHLPAWNLLDSPRQSFSRTTKHR